MRFATFSLLFIGFASGAKKGIFHADVKEVENDNATKFSHLRGRREQSSSKTSEASSSSFTKPSPRSRPLFQPNGTTESSSSVTMSSSYSVTTSSSTVSSSTTDSASTTEFPSTVPTSSPSSVTMSSSSSATSWIDVIEGETCFNANDMPELAWTRGADGSYSADLRLQVVTVTTALGTTRTRAYNGMIPGPLIRMKPCGIYRINLYNEQGSWPIGLDEEDGTNGLYDPTVTNLHLHGLHISGQTPGDDVFVTIEAGDSYEYKYTIPCDHSGGTHWYHPHHHGSTALQTDAGAAGMLIVESNSIESYGMPADIQAMPEQYLVIQEYIPALTSVFAFSMLDKVYSSNIVSAYELVNGCDLLNVTLEAGQWTRFRILNVAHEDNVLLSLAMTSGSEECEIGLLAKDGVWLAEVPRSLTTNNMFASIASRLDIAVRCSEAESEHSFRYQHLSDASANAAVTIATFSVVKSTRDAASDLTVWQPCRPAYLTDIESLPASQFIDPFSLEITGGLNDITFSDKDTYLAEVDLDYGQQWLVTASDQHPIHMHINHFQIGSQITSANQYIEIPDWHVAGDWVDTLDAPEEISVYIRPERFTGRMVLHCHVSYHGDYGVIGVIYINGDGDSGTGPATILDYGTCSEEVPLSTAYLSIAASIPGVIEAEEFDEGGQNIGYFNINIDRNYGSSMRTDGAVEIDTSTEDITYVSYIRDGEWLRYSADVTGEAYYSVTMRVASASAPNGMQWSLWVDTAEGCPAPGAEEGEYIAVSDPAYVGTGSDTVFEDYVAESYVFLSPGSHSLSLCFEGAGVGINIDSLTFEACGDTYDECESTRRNRREYIISAEQGAA